MTKIRGALAMLLLLPLLAFGASSVSVAESGAEAPAGPAMSEPTGQDSYTCCWLYFNGVWYCLPC